MTGRKAVETVFSCNPSTSEKAGTETGISYEKHDHRKLRADLCDFATTRNNESVATMAASYDLINGDDSWNAFLIKWRKQMYSWRGQYS